MLSVWKKNVFLSLRRHLNLLYDAEMTEEMIWNVNLGTTLLFDSLKVWWLKWTKMVCHFSKVFPQHKSLGNDKSFTQSCAPQSIEPPPILAHEWPSLSRMPPFIPNPDTITWYQWIWIPEERSTTFPLFCRPCLNLF